MKSEKLYCLIRPDLDCSPRCGIYLYHKSALDSVENNPERRRKVIEAERETFQLANHEWRKRLTESVIKTLNERGFDTTLCINSKILDQDN